MFTSRTGKTPDQLYAEMKSQYLSQTGSITGITGNCMDIADASTDYGAKVQLSACNNGPAQKWELNRYGLDIEKASRRGMRYDGHMRFQRYHRIRRHWTRLPVSVRKPAILIAGSLLIIIAALLSPLPGPGGIPLFLLGVAVLATEFVWAKRFQEAVMSWLGRLGAAFRRHKAVGSVLLLLGVSFAVSLSIAVFRFRSRH